MVKKVPNDWAEIVKTGVVKTGDTLRSLQEIGWLVRRRKKDVLDVVRGFKKLTRGRRGELGTQAEYFVSLLEVGLKEDAKARRVASRKKNARKRK